MNWSRKQKKFEQVKVTDSMPIHDKDEPISPDISKNEQDLKEIYKNCSDLVIRPIDINGETKILLVYIDGLCDTKTLEEVMLQPMMFEGLPNGLAEVQSIGQVLQQQLVAVTSVKSVSKISELVDGVLKANIGIVVAGETNALLADLKGYEKRGA